MELISLSYEFVWNLTLLSDMAASAGVVLGDRGGTDFRIDILCLRLRTHGVSILISSKFVAFHSMPICPKKSYSGDKKKE